MLSAFIAGILGPIEVIGTKVIYSKEKVNWKAFLSLSTVFMFLVTIFSYPLWGEFESSKITLAIIVLFFFDILIAIGYNVSYYYAISKEKISVIQPITMTSTIASMLIAAIIFPDERNWTILFLGIIAASALVFSRIEKHHLKFNRYILAAIAFVFLVGIENSIVRYLTESIDPLMLYTIRIGFLSILLTFILRPNFKKFGNKRVRSTAFVSFITAIEMLLLFYSISTIGVVKTNLIYLIAPVLIVASSYIYLKEPIKKKAVFADIIVVFCVATAIFFS